MTSAPTPSSTNIPLARPWLGDEELANLRAVLDSGMLTEGEYTRRFEEGVAAYAGAKHGVAVPNCTLALHLALWGLDIGPGDEVIVPDFSFPASGHAVLMAGATPVFVDVDPGTYNLDPTTLEAALSAKTAAIMPIHLFGMPAHMTPVLEFARRHGLRVIEDAACSLGMRYKGERKVWGDAACFSFHPRKHLTTGEGGLIATNDDTLAERLRTLKNHGSVADGRRRKFVEFAPNYRMSELQAAVGVAQLAKLPAMLAKRAAQVKLYDHLLANVKGFVPPARPAWAESTFQAYVGRVPGLRRDVIVEALAAQGIGTQIGTYCLHEQPSLKGARRVGPLDVASQLQEDTLTLPLHHLMSETNQERVTQAVERVVARA